MERISDRELQRLIDLVLPAVKMSFNPNFERCMNSALQELKERREADSKPLDADTIIKSLQKTNKPVLFITAENRAANGYFSGDIGDLLAMVEFTFEKIEKESDGEITKYDLIETLANEEASE